MKNCERRHRDEEKADLHISSLSVYAEMHFLLLCQPEESEETNSCRLYCLSLIHKLKFVLSIRRIGTTNST